MAGEARSIDPVQSLWTTYAANPGEPSRNALIEHYLPIVSKHAERLRNKLPSLVQLDELISAGVFGLMDSIEMFDPNAGVKFETYSAIRIRGAMLDELRAGDWVPRLVRTNSRKLSAATARLRQSLGREPAAEEVQSELAVSPEVFMRMTADVRPTEVVSMSAERDDDSDGPRISRQLVDERAADPVRSVQSHRLKEMLTAELSRRRTTRRNALLLRRPDDGRSRRRAWISPSRASRSCTARCCDDCGRVRESRKRLRKQQLEERLMITLQRKLLISSKDRERNQQLALQRDVMFDSSTAPDPLHTFTARAACASTSPVRFGARAAYAREPDR